MKRDFFRVSVHEACCAAIGILLSSQSVHSTFCISEVLKAVEDCYKLHPDSKQIELFFKGLTRKEDPALTYSIRENRCTKSRRNDACLSCGSDDNIYCTACCTQQKVFRCFTCDKDKIKLYCEVCWKKNHRGHKCEEFFYPARCASMPTPDSHSHSASNGFFFP